MRRRIAQLEAELARAQNRNAALVQQLAIETSRVKFAESKRVDWSTYVSGANQALNVGRKIWDDAGKRLGL